MNRLAQGSNWAYRFISVFLMFASIHEIKAGRAPTEKRSNLPNETVTIPATED